MMLSRRWSTSEPGSDGYKILPKIYHGMVHQMQLFGKQSIFEQQQVFLIHPEDDDLELNN